MYWHLNAVCTHTTTNLNTCFNPERSAVNREKGDYHELKLVIETILAFCATDSRIQSNVALTCGTVSVCIIEAIPIVVPDAPFC